MRTSVQLTLCAAALGLLLTSCTSTAPKPAAEVKPEPAPAPAVKEPVIETSKVPATFKVKFETSKGSFIVQVTKEWAPIGAERFHQLVTDGFFDGARFFRVVPNFMVQFGLAADPAKTRKWDRPIKDDPVARTNKPGAITFATAGPNTRTTQLFINYRSNQSLDGDGFAPFGEVIEGMDVVNRIYPGYGETPDQGQITRSGNAYLTSQFPNLDFIKKATIL